MAEPIRQLDSLFLAALDITSPEQRAAFLEESCGTNLELRREVEQLLKSNEQAGSFLEQPAPELQATVAFAPDSESRVAALNAGLAAAFDDQQAVVIGRAGMSVLKNLDATIDIPRIMLRDSVNEGPEPILKPQSVELPDRDADSRYQLQGEIARGGMGAILKGRDTDLGRDLAIKVLLDSHKDKPEVVQRFIEEAQIGGQLQHPGIAPVYELGQFADRRPFFSMKLVKGETLSKLLANRAEPSVDRAKLVGIFEQVCQTVAYAHSRGVIHRDLKPANIMVGAFGEVQVMDWGLAKVLSSGGVADERRARTEHLGLSSIRTLRNKLGSEVGTVNGVGSVGSQTQVGSVMGTPAYMPPEQALGEIDLMDERADVFGLGAILCEILTGKPPYIDDDGTVVYRMAARGKLEDCFARLDACGTPPRDASGQSERQGASRRSPGAPIENDGSGIPEPAASALPLTNSVPVDAELIAITKQCLSPEPVDRPRDAGVLSERITAHLASVESRLHAAELQGAAEAARAEEALRTVAETDARAKAEARAKRFQLMVAVVGLVAVSIGGVAAFSSAIYQRELKVAAVDARRKADDERLRADEARKKADELRLEAEAAAVREQQLATQARDAQKREAEMRNLAEEREQITQATLYAAQMNLAAQAADDPAGLRRVGEIVDAWKPDRVVRNLRGWEWYYLDSLRHLARKNLPNHSALGVCWSPDGKRYATFGRDHQLRVWETESEAQLCVAKGHTSYVYDARWNPAGTLLASAGRDHSVRFWDAADGSAVGASMEFPNDVVAVRWSPDGTRVAIKTEHEVAVCEVESRQVIRRWPISPSVANLSWHPQREQLAVPRAVLDVKTGETLWNHEGEFVEWSPDGTQLATSGFSRASILSADDGRELSTITIPNGSILAMNWSPNGDAVAFGLRDSTVRVWTPKTGQPLTILRGHSDVLEDVAWNHDGTRLASTAPDAIKLWDWPPRTNPAVIPTTHQQLSELFWTPDGQSVLIASDQFEQWQRDSLTLQSRVTIGGGYLESSWTPSVSWSHSAGSLASRRDGKLVLLDAQSGELRLEIPHNCDRMRAIALNDDGTRLATSAYRPKTADSEEHGEICLYNTATGGLVWKQKLHGDRAGGLAWSPDGKRLACNGWTSLEILNAEDGRSLVLYDVSKDLGWLHDMRWSPDGEQLVVACMNHTLRIVDSRSGRELHQLVGHTGQVRAVSWSPDGQRLASGSDDKTVRIWKAQSGLQVLVLKQHQTTVESVAWSPDGKQLATGSSRGEVLLWDCGSPLPLWPQQPAAEGVRSTQLQNSSNSRLLDGKRQQAAAVHKVASAEQELERLAKELAVDPQSEGLLHARAGLLARLGRWTETADTNLRVTQFKPTSRFAWGTSATPMLMAGETDRYREHCLAMIEQFRGTSSADVADTVCKTALLRPEVVPLKDLPIQTLRDGVDDPKWEPIRPWFVACCALISYREGQHEEAIRWTTRMPTFQSQPGALALIVRAMSEHKLGHLEAARKSLKAAELQIPLVLRTLGSADDSTSLPVPVGTVDHDWLVPELLRREAAELF